MLLFPLGAQEDADRQMFCVEGLCENFCKNHHLQITEVPQKHPQVNQKQTSVTAAMKI